MLDKTFYGQCDISLYNVKYQFVYCTVEDMPIFYWISDSKNRRHVLLYNHLELTYGTILQSIKS